MSSSYRNQNKFQNIEFLRNYRNSGGIIGITGTTFGSAPYALIILFRKSVHHSYSRHSMHKLISPGCDSDNGLLVWEALTSFTVNAPSSQKT